MYGAAKSKNVRSIANLKVYIFQFHFVLKAVHQLMDGYPSSLETECPQRTHVSLITWKSWTSHHFPYYHRHTTPLPHTISSNVRLVPSQNFSFINKLFTRKSTQLIRGLPYSQIDRNLKETVSNRPKLIIYPKQHFPSAVSLEREKTYYKPNIFLRKKV